MKKKGFTLIELLATIAIISILMLLLIPNLINSTNTKRNKISSTAKDMIYHAADIYIEDNSSNYPKEFLKAENKAYCIKLETLVNEGKLTYPITDLKTNKEIPLTYYVKATLDSHNQFVYDLVDASGCNAEITYKITNKESYTTKKKITIYYPKKEYVNKYKILSGTTKENIDLNKEITVTSDPSITFTSNGTIVFWTESNGQIIDEKTVNISKIDNGGVNATLAISDKKTNEVTLSAVCSANSGIRKIEFSKDGGLTWDNNNINPNKTYTGLEFNKTYDFKVRCTSNTIDADTNEYSIRRIANISTKTDNIGMPTIDITNESIWKNSKIVTISGTVPTGSELKYKVVNGNNIKQDWAVISSGTTYNIDYHSNPETPTYVYAKITDDTNTVDAITKTQTKVDITPPSEASISIGAKSTTTVMTTATCTDNESDIKKVEFSSNGGSTWIDNGTNRHYKFTRLTSGGTYNFMVRCTNNADLKTSSESVSATVGSYSIDFTPITRTRPLTEYSHATSVIVPVTFTVNNVTSHERYIKVSSIGVTSSISGQACGSSTNPETCSGSATTSFSAGTWYKLSENSNPTLTLANTTSSATVYARINDGNELLTSATQTISNIDISAPTAAVANIGAKTTSTVVVNATCTDNDSGTYKIEYSKDNGISWVDNGTNTSYRFTELTAGADYDFKVKCTNNAGLQKTSDTTTSTVGSHSIEFTPITRTKPLTEYSHATSVTVPVLFTVNNVTSHTRYIKVSSIGVTSSVSGQACGTGTEPENCSGSNITNFSAGTWYKLSSNNNPTLTLASTTNSATVYARINDGNEYLTSATQTITNIDISEPQAEVTIGAKTTTTIVANATCTDNDSGISKIEFSKDGGNTWINNEKDTAYMFTGLTAGTNYNIKVKCTNNSGLQKTSNNAPTKSGSHSIAFTPITRTRPIEEYSHATSVLVPVTFTVNDITSHTRYIKVGSIGVTSSISGQPCGNVTDPSACSGDNTTNFSAGYWYKLSENTDPSLTLESTTSSATVYARINDGNALLASATQTISNIDISEPTAAIATVGTKSTTTVEINATCTDIDSGISKIEFSKDDGSWINNGTSTNYKFTELSSGSSHSFKVRCTNNAGLQKTSDTVTATVGSHSIAFTPITRTRPLTEYSHATSVEVPVVFTVNNVTSHTRYIKVSSIGVTSSISGQSCGNQTDPSSCSGTSTKNFNAGYWYKLSETNTNPILTLSSTTSSATVYARINDGNALLTAATQTISNIDSTVPTEATVGIGTKTTTTIVVNATCTDNDSGISKIEFSKDNGEWIDNGTNTRYTFTGLTAGTNYNFKVRCTNNAGLQKTGDNVPTKSGSHSIAFTPITRTPTTSISTYAKSVSIPVKFTVNDITNHTRYVKVSSIDSTSSIPGQACGQSTDPETCSGSNTTSFSAGYWYKLNENSDPTLTLASTTSSATVYARINDGNELLLSSTQTISNIDATAPSQSIEIQSSTPGSNGWYTALKVRATLTDSGGSGVASAKYCVTTGSTCDPSTGTTLSTSGSNKYFDYTFENSANAQKICVQTWDKATNVSTKTCSDTYKVDTDDPGIAWKIASSTSGTSPWYQALTIKATGSDSGSGISSASYCTTTSSSTTISCSPSTAITPSNDVITLPAFDSSSNYQGACATLTDVSGRSSTTCSTGYKVDTTAANTTSPSLTSTTSNIVVTRRQADSHSNISETQYGISTSATGAYSWQDTNVFAGKKNNTLYYIKTRVKNGAGLGWTVSDYNSIKTKDFGEVNAKITLNNPEVCSPTRIATVTFSDTNMTNAYYYIKANRQVKLNQSSIPCGSDISSCVGNEPAGSTLVDGNWYQVYGTVDVTFDKNGSLYVKVSDGTNTYDTPTATVTKADNQPPSDNAPTVAANSISATVTTGQTDNCQIGSLSYQIRKDGENYGSTWQSSGSFTGLSPGTKYWARTKANDQAGNGEVVSKETSFTTWIGIPAKSYSVGEVVSYGGRNWKVVSDNGTTSTLISADNIATGAYTSASTQINSLINNNTTYTLDKNASKLTNAGLPTRTTMPSNNSGTPFWTSTSGGNGYYLLNSSGGTTGQPYKVATFSDSKRYYASSIDSYSSGTVHTGCTVQGGSNVNAADSASSGSSALTLTNANCSSSTDAYYSSNSTSSGQLSYTGSGDVVAPWGNVNGINALEKLDRSDYIGTQYQEYQAYHATIVSVKTLSSSSAGDVSTYYCNISNGQQLDTRTLYASYEGKDEIYACPDCNRTCGNAALYYLNGACNSWADCQRLCTGTTIYNTLIQYYQNNYPSDNWSSGTYWSIPGTDWTTEYYNYNTTSTSDCRKVTTYGYANGSIAIGIRPVITVAERY